MMHMPPCGSIRGMPLIETYAITKQYPAVRALDDFSVEIDPGLTGIVGSNGAGKSTLIKILLGLLPPTSGTATVLDYDIHRDGPTLRQYVGYLPEHDCLPGDMTATEFVSHMAQVSGLPGAAARERTAETLRHVGLFEERYRHLAGYSTGMKQRVKLAQALVHDPKIIFLDEPTNGLDPAGRDEMLDLIRKIGIEFGISMLFCTHLLGEIERTCDHLVVIDAGKLVKSAPLAEFTQEVESLRVEIDGDATPVLAQLEAAGISVESEDRRFIKVSYEGQPPFDAIRDAVVEAEAGLIRIEQRRNTLEDLFRTETTGANLEEDARV